MNPWAVLLDPRPLLPQATGAGRVHSIADEAPAGKSGPRNLASAAAPLPPPASRLIKPEPAPGPRAYRVPAPKPAIVSQKRNSLAYKKSGEAVVMRGPADGGASARAAREERTA